MTNKEWVLEKMQNMSDEKLANILHISKIDKNFAEEWCRKACEEKANCIQCRKEWLKQEHKEEIKLSEEEHKEKIKLSEAERVILENIDKKYKWIARDYGDDTYVYMEKPTKDASEWSAQEHVEGLRTFKHLFQFIKWEDDEPYNIDDLLQ